MSNPTKNYDPSEQYKTPKKSDGRPKRTRTPSLKAIENRALGLNDDNSQDGTTTPSRSSEPRYKLRRSARKVSPAASCQPTEYNNSADSVRRVTRKQSIDYSSEDSVRRVTRHQFIDLTVESDETEENAVGGMELELPASVRPKPIDIQLLEDHNVAGRSLFGFNTPKKRDSMALAARNTPKTPRTPKLATKTPDTKRKIAMDPKTPSHVRRNVKTQISKLVESNSESDFSEDFSDFEPSDNESLTSSDDASSVASAAEDDEPKTPNKRQRPIVVPVLPKTPSAAKLRASTRKKSLKNVDFIPESDGYFQSHGNSKMRTSNRTLDRLKNPRLPADRLFSLLANMKLSDEHEKSIADMVEEYKSYFSKWLFLLNEGFSVLLYGLGSKRNLLQSFHREVLKEQTVLVVNGFFPSLTIKDILDSITNDILDIGVSPANSHEAVDVVEHEFGRIPETHLFLIVHNIDGSMLRNGKAQSILSRLAKVPNIHLLASTDHINTPLLWNQTKLSNFNFSWWDCTTMLPYSDETAFENSLLVQNSGELALSSLRSVFSSLTTNSRGVYMLIVKYQLQGKDNPQYQGMLFKDLYWSCRESFLVSSDLALRAQLTEFLDHKLVKSKRSIDGSELLTIPIASSLLLQFLEEQQAEKK